MGEYRAGWLEHGMGLERMRLFFRTGRCLRADGFCKGGGCRVNSIGHGCDMLGERRLGEEGAGDMWDNWFWCTDLGDELGERDGGWG